MITMKLTDDEVVVLHSIIKAFITEIRDEIMHTDRKEYREMLKQREAVARKIMEELEAQTTKETA